MPDDPWIPGRGAGDMKLKVWSITLGLTCALTLGCGRPSRPMLVVGSKTSTEQVILGELVAQFIEVNTLLSVDRKLNLGGTFTCFSALRRGDIDLYVEYTGTGLAAILNEPPDTDPGTVLRKVRRAFRERYDLEWLEPLGFNNTYAFAMPRERAQALLVARTTDLGLLLNGLVLGVTSEFAERPDGLTALLNHYGFDRPQDVREMDPEPMYRAIGEGDVDLICASSTDGRIRGLDLVLLEDDRRFFPPHEAAPLIRGEVIDRHPDVGPLLRRLGGTIDDAKMQELNYQVDEGGRPAREVARAFLSARGLISETSSAVSSALQRSNL